MTKIFACLLLGSFISVSAQTDTELLGKNNPFRDFWDVRHYTVEVEPNLSTQSLKGKVKIRFKVLRDTDHPKMQLDLQEPMRISRFSSDLPVGNLEKKGRFWFLSLNKSLKKDQEHWVELAYEGKPQQATKAPWDGGWVFSKDQNGKDFASAANQEDGASLWFPCKDLWADKADEGATLKIHTPKGLTGVGNGRLFKKEINKDHNLWIWKVTLPISTYNIIPYIGDFIEIKDTYNGQKGKLDLDYFVLRGHEDIARKQLKQVPKLLDAFEYWFGEYPFYQDTYKVVEAPYLGMEHQSNIAYGNGWQNGYKGSDLSGTGVGLNWDFILVHESGHEWFGNSLTATDTADMWIHEAFTNYAEVLYTHHLLGKQKADIYAVGLQKNIQNDRPIIPERHARAFGSSDMYYRGSAMLHTLRQAMNNDQRFRRMLHDLTTTFRHSSVSTQQIIDRMQRHLDADYSGFFHQYLHTTQVPILRSEKIGDQYRYRWENVVPNFYLPIWIENTRYLPSTEWQTSPKDLSPSPSYYIKKE